MTDLRYREEEETLRAYLNSIKNIPLLTPEEEKELGRKIQKGDKEALEKLVKSNLRFVVSVARKYRSFGVSLLDLINEGNLGLIQAAKKFDPERDIRFISYAVWWIKQTIIKTLSEQGILIKIPIKMRAKQSKIAAAKAKYLQKYKISPKKEEIEKLTGLSEAELRSSEQARLRIESLNVPVGEEKGVEVIDLLKVEEETAEDKVILDSLIKHLKEIIESSLNEREKDIIIMRYGLDGKGKRTLQEIGKKYNISKERVRQIENEIKKKLKEKLTKEE
ncbi:MAG: RNA polymerase sigma factor RpoD/SigA [Deltaproteobacteria bacterium]|nr:RNA polymerase sigma factor RpoD/SigA [Deltaproteobacteria bacterium]